LEGDRDGADECGDALGLRDGDLEGFCDVGDLDGLSVVGE